MILSAPTLSTRSLRLDVLRTTQPGLARESALEGDSGFAACVRLENATFQPGCGFEIVSAGTVRLSFPNPRTLRIVSCQVARRVAHGVPLAVFGATMVRLRDLTVLVDENAIALVGEVTHMRIPGEWSLSLRGLGEVCHLPPTAATRPFAFPLPRPVTPEAPVSKSDAPAVPPAIIRPLGARRPTARATASRLAHSRPNRVGHQ